MAHLHDPAKAVQCFLIELIPAQEFRIVEEVAQEPAQLPQSLGGAVESAGDGATSQFMGFDDRKPKRVERLLRMPSVLSPIHTDQEDAVGSAVTRDFTGFVQTFNPALHAAPSLLRR